MKSLARVRIAYLQEDIRLSKRADPRDQGAELALSAAESAIKRADEALTVRRGFGAGLRNWWTGWDKEQAWLALHAAEAQLALDEPEDAVRAELSSLQAEIRVRLRASDPHRTAWTETLEAARTSSEKVDRYLVRQIKETLHASPTGPCAHTELPQHPRRDVRSPRRGGRARDSGRLGLDPARHGRSDAAEHGCGRRGSDDTAAGSKDPAEQPADEEGAEDETEASDSGVDAVWQIELLGALGGFLAALAAIQRFRGSEARTTSRSSRRCSRSPRAR